MKRAVFIGFDDREGSALAVARHSLLRTASQPIEVGGLVLSDLEERGLYRRPIKRKTTLNGHGYMWDVLSDAPMSTEFACSRFLTARLASNGWGLFVDCDVLFRHDIHKLFDQLDPKYAVYCVKFDFMVSNFIKMDLQPQVKYHRKLWSSVCVYNADHPANLALTDDYINSVPGRTLHAFEWLKDSDIGELGAEWNWVPNHSPEAITDPSIVHFSEGGPWFQDYADVPFADEWRQELRLWAKGG